MIKSSAAIIALLVFLTGCVSSSVNRPDVSIDAEVARLQQLGFRQVTRTGDGTRILQYSGRINSAVECRQGAGGEFARVAARGRNAQGQSRTITLDAYLQLSPGTDGVLRNSGRDGIYIITVKTRDGGRSVLTGTKFGPRGQGALPSGLTCRAA